MKLYSDLDEVLSSPVRDASRGLARLTAGEVTLALDCFSDGSAELRAGLQSLLLEDIRPDNNVLIRRYIVTPLSTTTKHKSHTYNDYSDLQ